MNFKKGTIARNNFQWITQKGLTEPYYVICSGNKGTENKSFKGYTFNTSYEFSLLYEAYELYTDIFED